MTNFHMSDEKINNSSINVIRNSDQKRIFSKNNNSSNNSLEDKILDKINLKSKSQNKKGFLLNNIREKTNL